MVWCTYKCRECGVSEDEKATDQVIDLECPRCNRLTRHDRQWSAPHLGPMSSGEPPR